MKKRFILFIIGIVLPVVLFSQMTKRDVDIIKSNAQVNFNNDVTITNSTSNTLTVSGGVFSLDAGLTVDGTSGLVINKLILKDGQLTAISSTNDTLNFYTAVADRVDSSASFVEYSQGTTAPSSTPSRIGLVYYDTTNKKLYFSTGTSSSSDWTAAN